MSDLALRATLCEVGRRLWQKDLIGAAEGNITAKIDDQRLLCTPSGFSKGHLKPADLLVIDPEGNKLEGQGEVSSEIRLHLRAFARRSDCQAVIHAHPLTAIALSLLGETIPDNLLPEAAYVLGPVAVLPFAFPGTDEVPDGMEPYLADHKTFILSHHGAAVLGKDLWDACYRMETLERIAEIVHRAKLLGAPKPMPDEAFHRILEKSLNGKLD